MPISFTQAALGAEVDVPTLEGKSSLKIPKGTQHGAIFRLDGQGLPDLRSGRRGDLVVGVKVEIPRKLTAKQEKLLRDFAETEDKAVLPESHGFLGAVWIVRRASQRREDHQGRDPPRPPVARRRAPEPCQG
jgi:molecular chaperone DnaJ